MAHTGFGLASTTFLLRNFIKSLPNAFGKDLVKKQRKILMMINFGGCEGVSANYFDILKASIDLKFFVRKDMDV